MPNIESLNLGGLVVSDTFLRPDSVPHTKCLPSLRHLCLGYSTLRNDNDWSPLTTYLTYQTSGDQAISLRICGNHPPIPSEVVREIEGLVEEFNLGYPGEDKIYQRTARGQRNNLRGEFKVKNLV